MAIQLHELNEKEIRAVAKLMIGEDFPFVIDYIERIRDDLQHRSLMIENEVQMYRVQGGALALDEIVQNFLNAREIIARKTELARKPKLPKVF